MTDFNPNGYEFKNVKTLLTSDGAAFTAVLYKNGKKVADVENSGHGGADMVYWTDKKHRAEFDAWVATLGTHTVPAMYGMDEFTMQHNEETALGEIMTIWENAAEVKRMDAKAKKAVLYRVAGDAENEQCRVAKPPAGHDPTSPATLALYKAKAPWWSKVVSVWVIGKGWQPVA